MSSSLSSFNNQKKSVNAFRTIGEVSNELGVPPHVLRFWESKFSQIKPHKRRGGHRYYRPTDITLIREVKALLYDKGFTIKGAQKHLKTTKKSDGETGEQTDLITAIENTKSGSAVSGSAPEKGKLNKVLGELIELKNLLSNNS